jgi:hypothetical protein
MKTASARFFFWSASFHEEGGLLTTRVRGILQQHFSKVDDQPKLLG